MPHSAKRPPAGLRSDTAGAVYRRGRASMPLRAPTGQETGKAGLVISSPKGLFEVHRISVVVSIDTERVCISACIRKLVVFLWPFRAK